MECYDIHDQRTRNIDQSGFNPSFKCTPNHGYEFSSKIIILPIITMIYQSIYSFRCKSKAPCHPCPLMKVRLWCGCQTVREAPLPPTVATTTVTVDEFTNPVECHDYHDHGNWSITTCEDSCWRVAYFDFELGNVRNEYGKRIKL